MNKILKKTIPRTLLCTFGLIIIGTSISLQIASNIGLGPWDVFHQGLANILDYEIGLISIIVGFVIMFASFFFKVFPGIGSILNIVITGISIDLTLPLFSTPDTLILKIATSLIAIILLAFGCSLYISSNIGAGPRDSFTLALVRRYNIEVKIIKPIIEGVVIVIGVLLGGSIGIGTIMTLLLTGYFMDIFFKIFKYNPKSKKQGNLITQLKSIKRLYQDA